MLWCHIRFVSFLPPAAAKESWRSRNARKGHDGCVSPWLEKGRRAGRSGSTGMPWWLQAEEAGRKEAGQEPFITRKFASSMEQIVFSCEGKYISVGSSANLVPRARAQGLCCVCRMALLKLRLRPRTWNLLPVTYTSPV